jgi:hypothetical protein
MKDKDTKSGLFVVSKRSPSSSLRKYLVAGAAGAAISLVDYILGYWLAARGLHQERRLIDLVLLAIFTGALVLVIEISHERERKRMNARSRTILLMNHHIRNALQSILDSAYVHGNLDEVHTSVDRIAWALQEILPGESSEKDENFVGLPERPHRVQFPRKEV